MEKQFFKITLREEGEVVVNSWINLKDIMQIIYEGETAFLMLREQRSSLQPLEVPTVTKLKGQTKIGHDVQVRNVEDFLTIKVTNKEDIDRLTAWADTQSI